jgi:hypothetical protein
VNEVVIKLKQLHPAQVSILTNAKRFNVIKCGRRFGKTELAIDLVVNTLLNTNNKPEIVGYWTPTYKDLHEVWQLLKYTLYDVILSKDETVKQIVTVNGSKLDMWSMEDPNSGRGRKYHRAIIDEAEKARNFKEAWEQTIRATLTDYKGDAWFFSTPKFGQTYFKEIANNQEKYKDWITWKFTTYDNPHIDPTEVDAAKAQLDSKTFECEYLAEDVDLSNNPFAYAFDPVRHVGKTEYNPFKEVLLSFDFNVDPIVCIAAQKYDDKLHFIKDFSLANSDIYELCDRIKAYFPKGLYFVTGDATGHNRSALAKGNINYYTVIKQSLNLLQTQLKQPSVNPAVSDRRVMMNSVLQNFDVLFDKDNCGKAINDMKMVEVDSYGDIKKDRSKETRKADLMDATGYLICTFMKGFIKYH